MKVLQTLTTIKLMVYVDHLDRDGNSIKQYQLRGAFPTSLDGIALSYGTNDAIEDFGVTLDLSIL